MARTSARRSLELLDEVELDGGERLLQGAFVYGLLVQHEHQHVETMLQALQLRDDPYPLDEPGPRAGRAAGGEVRFDGGTFVLGTDDEPWAYDNERPAHEIELAPFLIDRLPVTNVEFAEFVAAGGYDDPQFWHPAGWASVREQAIEHPAYWRREGAGWSRRRFGHRETLPAEEPVQHVCWYEADAYARWAGKRLPTESEWERAVVHRVRRGEPRERALRPGGGGLGLPPRAPSSPWRRLGVDGVRLRGLPRLRDVPVCGILGSLLRF